MRRRAFMQLLGIAGVAATAAPYIDLTRPVEELPPAEQERILEEILPDRWCKIDEVEVSAWLLGVTFSNWLEPQEATFAGEPTEFYVPSVRSANIDFQFDTFHMPYQVMQHLHNVFERGKRVTVEFGMKGQRSYAFNALAYQVVQIGELGDIPTVTLHMRPQGSVTVS